MQLQRATIPVVSADMRVARFTFFCAALVALVSAALWQIDSDPGFDAERRLRPAAASPPNGATRAGPARAATARDPEPHGEAGRVPGESGSDVPRSGRGSPDARPVRASLPASGVAADPAAAEAWQAPPTAARDMSATEIEERWRSRDPDDQAVAIDGLNAIAYTPEAVDLVQQMIVDTPIRNDSDWEALAGLDSGLKVYAGAEMLFSSGPEQAAAVRLFAGDRWQHATQVLNEILATTDAAYESHGDLVAIGMLAIGEGAEAGVVRRELRQSIGRSSP